MWSRNKKESISLLKPKRHHDIILFFINPTKVDNCEKYIYEILYKTIVLKFLYQGTISLEKSYPGYDISGEIVPRVRFLQRNRTHSIWLRFLLGTISPGYDFSSNHIYAYWIKSVKLMRYFFWRVYMSLTGFELGLVWLIVAGVLSNIYLRWIVMFDFICINSAELWGTGSKKIKNKNKNMSPHGIDQLAP